MPLPLVNIRHLNLQLGGRAVLQDIDLELAAGDFIALLGPNGAGKTSLLRCLAGLLPADEGTITLDDRLLHDLPRDERARRLTYLPQDADCHWPMKVEDVVALGRLPHRLAGQRGWSSLSDACRQAIEKAITESDLQRLRERPVDNLSGGERRRVMLARSLATDADILLADEPAAGLDPAHQLQLMEMLGRKAADGMTVIVVLHDLALAARYCHRLILMQGGRILADGSAGEVMTSERLATAYGIDAYIGDINDLPVIVPLRARHDANRSGAQLTTEGKTKW